MNTQLDNGRPHNARVSDYSLAESIDVLPSPSKSPNLNLCHQNHRTCTALVTKITGFKPHYTLQITNPTTRADLKQALQEKGHNTPQAHYHLKETSSIEFVFLDFTHCLAICYCRLYHNNIAIKQYYLNNINLILI